MPKNIPDPVELTRELVRMDSINPPGNEAAVATHLAEMLNHAGFELSFPELEPGRPNLVATLGLEDCDNPICFTAHMDTVPLGKADWSVAPHGADIIDGKLYGRGSSDMKSGLAAMTTAALELAAEGRRGLILVFTAGEEKGCQGARKMEEDGILPKAGAILVGEPTGALPCLGHKGALRFDAEAKGVTAHSAIPHKGDNAIYKAARAICKLADYEYPEPPHFALGKVTLNVGVINGGINANSVPDKAVFSIDIRTLPGMDHDRIQAAVAQLVEGEVELHRVQSSQGIWTDAQDPWVAGIYNIVAARTGERPKPAGVPYFTDGPSLWRAMGEPPLVVLGPGEAEQAHVTDEWCLVDKISLCHDFYVEIGRSWMK